MDQIPECIWDAEHGLIVLFRRIDRAEEAQGPFPALQLVVELSSGGDAYYAGEMPADRGIWVVKAPCGGQFRLLFFPSGAPRLLLGEPLAAMPFDDQIYPEPDNPVGMHHQLTVWLFHSVTGFDGGERRPEPEEVLLEENETLAEGLDRYGWRIGDAAGLAVHRRDGNGRFAKRGPAVHPFRHLEEEIDVTFTLIPDDAEPPKDLVALEGFEQLYIPTIDVDLTPFGETAWDERGNFHFIYRPHGPDAEPRYIRGADLEIVEDPDGGPHLFWLCASACHLDFLGVYYAGNKVLRPHGDESYHVYIRGHERLEPASALIGMFYGDVYQMRPIHEIVHPDALREQLGADGLAVVGLEIQRNAAWAAIDERWADMDLRGADDAGAFTLTAYAELLEQLLDAAEVDEGPRLALLMDRSGIPYRRFSELERRPDLLFALVVEPRLACLLGDGRLQVDALMDPAHWSPATSLAAALEPGDLDLPRWLEAEAPAVQRALWLFMLAGGDASAWRDLAVPLEAVDGGFDRLAKLLHIARVEPLSGLVASTAQDLGLDTEVLERLPRTFSAAQTRAHAIVTVNNVLDSELQAVNETLHEGLEWLRLKREDLIPAFEAALEGGAVPSVEDLKRQVAGYCAPLGGEAAELVPRLLGLKTRIVLWGLARALAGASQDQVGPGADSAPASAVSGTGASGAVDETAASVAAGPQATEPSVLLRWLLQVLDHKAFEYPPQAGDADSEGVDVLLPEVEGLLVDIEDYWGLRDGAEPQPLPDWTGANAVAGKDAEAAFRRAYGQAACELDATGMGDGVEMDLDAIKKLLERVERASRCLVADMVWEDTKRRARERAADTGDPRLEALVERMRVSGSEQWAALAGVLDRLSAGLTVQV